MYGIIGQSVFSDRLHLMIVIDPVLDALTEKGAGYHHVCSIGANYLVACNRPKEFVEALTRDRNIAVLRGSDGQCGFRICAIRREDAPATAPIRVIIKEESTVMGDVRVTKI